DLYFPEFLTIQVDSAVYDRMYLMAVQTRHSAFAEDRCAAHGTLLYSANQYAVMQRGSAAAPRRPGYPPRSPRGGEPLEFPRAAAPVATHAASSRRSGRPPGR